MNRGRESVRLARGLLVYAFRSGRWWTPVVVLALAVAVGVAAAASHVLPASVYVLF